MENKIVYGVYVVGWTCCAPTECLMFAVKKVPNYEGAALAVLGYLDQKYSDMLCDASLLHFIVTQFIAGKHTGAHLVSYKKKSTEDGFDKIAELPFYDPSQVIKQ